MKIHFKTSSLVCVFTQKRDAKKKKKAVSYFLYIQCIQLCDFPRGGFTYI